MFRGWLQLGDREIANTSRVVALAVPSLPASDAAAVCVPCRNTRIAMDESWPGLAAYLGDPDYADITTAPWYDAAVPASAEFYGVWIMSAGGFDATPFTREVGNAVCAGGVAGRHRDTYRTMPFSALLWGCTHRGARYGLRWLNCQLRTARTRQTLRYLDAHPESGPATGLERMLRRVVLTSPATISEYAGTPTDDHQQASLLRADFELAAMDPYSWTATTVTPVVWDTDATTQIEWAHAPDCVQTSSCDLPELLSIECAPAVIDTRPAPVPVCGGCIPVCDIQTRTWEIDLSGYSDCDVIAASVQVTAGVDDITAQFFWRPCGSSDICEETGQLQVTGLAAGATVIADSIDGRGYGIVSGQRVRQRGIVGTPSGRPWRSTVLTPGCWELVAKSAPGLDYTVTVETTGRSE